MDWEQLRERTLGDIGTSLATEGIGVAAGFIGASLAGRQIENRILGKDAAGVQKYITSADTGGDKFKAWAGNNIPKAALWYLLRGYTHVAPGEVLTPGKEITVDAKKAFAGSIVFDSLIRLTNKGVPIGPVKFAGIDWLAGENAERGTGEVSAETQRLIQENTSLRTELNKALIAAGVKVHVAEYPEVRERRYGFMDEKGVFHPANVGAKGLQIPPAISERQRKYGFANVESEKATNMFGML